MATIIQRVTNAVAETIGEKDPAKILLDARFEGLFIYHQWWKFFAMLGEVFPQMREDGNWPDEDDVNMWETIMDVVWYIDNLDIVPDEDEPSTPAAATTAVLNPFLTKVWMAIMPVKPLLGPESIHPESKLHEDLGLRKGDIEAIVYNLEEELGAHAQLLFSASEIGEFETVQDIIDALERQQVAKAQAAAIMTTTEAE